MLGAGSAGGSPKAGALRRSRLSSRLLALASRYVRAGRFHFVSMSLRIDVWSCTTCDTYAGRARGDTITAGTRKPYRSYAPGRSVGDSSGVMSSGGIAAGGGTWS